MEFAQYFCLLTVSGLNSFRNTKNTPLDIIRTNLQNVNIDEQTTDSDAFILGEIPDVGMQPYSKWFSYIVEQEALTLRPWIGNSSEGDNFETFVSVGVYYPQKNLAWSFIEDPAPLFKITPEAFLTFIDKQTDPAAFRKAILNSVSDYSQSNFSKPVANSELNEFILSPEGRIFFEYNGEDLWYQIREEYVSTNRSIQIAEDYKNLIYEIDDSYFKGKKMYGFEESANRTAKLSFKLLQNTPENLFQPHVVDDDKFCKGLSQIINLADKIESPFKDAFTSSLSILELSKKNLSLKDLVKTCETTINGREIINRKAGALEHFEGFGINAMTLGRLLACEVSDVFGGMGSWNDQYIPPEHQEDYSVTSSNFFTDLAEYKASVISSFS